jgi:hypothetical protein
MTPSEDVPIDVDEPVDAMMPDYSAASERLVTVEEAMVVDGTAVP